VRLDLRSIAFCLTLPGTVAFATPDRVPDDWVVRQVDRFVAAARAVCEDRHAVPAYEKLLGELAKTIEQRRPAQDKASLGASRRFVDYIEAASLDLKPDHKLGFNVTDKQYFAETQQYVQIPPFLLDQQLLRWASRSETLDKAKTFLHSLNSTREPSDQLIFFSYRSRHLGTPDNNNSYRRLLIVVPGDASQGIPEKWVQFGVTDPGERTLVRNISIISALPNSDGTFDSYFKDYYRIYRRNASIQIKGRWELGYGDDNCAQCHKTGVLPIFPVAGSVNENEKESLWAANERFPTYGRPRFGKYLDERKFGPGLADADPESRMQRFGKTFAQTAVAKAMVCARCHSDQDLGALNWPLSVKVVKSFIKGGRMPLGHNLSERDRSALYRYLIDEYFAADPANPGILKSWLLERDAQSGPTVSSIGPEATRSEDHFRDPGLPLR
jgi:hypothetical protein